MIQLYSFRGLDHFLVQKLSMPHYKNLILVKNDHVATITFNRPRKMNALDSAHLEEIEHVALSFRDDPKTRVVVFTGTGKHFS